MRWKEISEEQIVRSSLPEGFIDAIGDSYEELNLKKRVLAVRETKDTLELPDIEVGDQVLVGKFKNRKATVKGFTKDKNNQPVLKTDKGDQKLFKPRIAKLMQEAAGTLQPTPNMIAKASAFVFEKWKERAAERGEPTPTDLSNSCKFSSLFAQALFGGQIAGNYDHQYLDFNGKVIDLNVDAADVDALKNPYANDPKFLRHPDFKASLASCKPRVAKWVKEFKSTLNTEPVKEAAGSSKKLYHGTSSLNYESILDDGVSDPSYWGTFENAKYFARGTCEETGGDPMIIAKNISDFSQYDLKVDENIIDFQINNDPKFRDRQFKAWNASGKTWQDCLRIFGAVKYDNVVYVEAHDFMID
jgi:hypothetical protein